MGRWAMQTELVCGSKEQYFLVSVDTDQQGTGKKRKCSLDKYSLSSPGPVIWECSNTGDRYQYSNTIRVMNDISTEVLKFFEVEFVLAEGSINIRMFVKTVFMKLLREPL